jgi:hypothetical protein
MELLGWLIVLSSPGVVAGAHDCPLPLLRIGGTLTIPPPNPLLGD